MLHPDFPTVEGHHQMTGDWAVTLPGPFNRRVEDGSLVFWRPNFTVWTIVWNNDDGETPQQRLTWLQRDSSPEAFDAQVVTSDRVLRYTYRITEHRDEGAVYALYAFAIGRDGHVQMALYFDAEADLETARQIAGSLIETHTA